MAASPLDSLSAWQLLYLEWLLDERPSSGPVELEPGSNRIADSSPSKGSKTFFAQRHGVSLTACINTQKTAKFQAAYRAALNADIRDPSYMMEVIRNVRRIATGEVDTKFPTDQLKAAELYARLTGYIAPDAAPEAAPATELTTEQLEARIAESRSKAAQPRLITT